MHTSDTELWWEGHLRLSMEPQERGDVKVGEKKEGEGPHTETMGCVFASMKVNQLRVASWMHLSSTSFRFLSPAGSWKVNVRNEYSSLKILDK